MSACLDAHTAYRAGPVPFDVPSRPRLSVRGGNAINSSSHIGSGAAPALDGLPEATREARGLFERVSGAREGWVNGQGGDVASAGSHRALVRHTANYLAAASLAGQAPQGAHIVDVGGGVGAFTVWLSERLGARGTLIDADEEVLRVAGAAFPDLDTAIGMDQVPARSAWLVTAMEVVEHVPPEAQVSFVRGLAELVAPGGALVLSTPDESRFVGGWSGYSPHVGVLTADSLRELLREATGREPEIWRLEGEPFAVNGAERVLLPVANRAVGTLRRIAPAALDRLGHAFTRFGGLLPRRGNGVAESARAVPAEQGQGSGLLGVVRFS